MERRRRADPRDDSFGHGPHDDELDMDLERDAERDAEERDADFAANATWAAAR